MKNVITTIPAKRYRNWALCERILRRCQGQLPGQKKGGEYWRVNLARMPRETLTGRVCFMVFGGKVRGYFHIIDVAPQSAWVFDEPEEERPQSPYCMILGVFTPFDGPPMEGFQGWRYTDLQPF